MWVNVPMEWLGLELRVFSRAPLSFVWGDGDAVAQGGILEIPLDPAGREEGGEQLPREPAPPVQTGGDETGFPGPSRGMKLVCF